MKKPYRISKVNLAKIHEELFEVHGKNKAHGWWPLINCECKACKEYRRVAIMLAHLRDDDPEWEQSMDFITFIRVIISEMADHGLMPDDVEGLTLVGIRRVKEEQVIEDNRGIED